MPTLATLIARGIRATAAVSPALAGALAAAAFFSTAPRMKVREADAATHLSATRETLRVRGADVVVYRWGTGEPAVLLMHGWRGRASQFATLVRELVAEGHRVVAFDAPSHGSSSRNRADVRDWVADAERLQQTDGPFAAIIGHSFGGFAALTAARTTAPAPKVMVIAGAAAPEPFLTEFTRELRLTPATAAHLKRQFLARIEEDAETLIARYDAQQHPLAEPTQLLVVHDLTDRRMPDTSARHVHQAHGERSRLLRTHGFGHTRVLTADAVLDAAAAFMRGGLSAVDELTVDEAVFSAADRSRIIDAHVGASEVD